MGMIVALDFDGTVVVDEFPAIGQEIPEMVHLIKWMMQIKCYEVILWTCRTGEYLEAAEQWFAEREIFFQFVNEGVADIEIGDRGDKVSRKIFAHVYLDDQSLMHLPSPMLIRELLETTERHVMVPGHYFPGKERGGP